MTVDVSAAGWELATDLSPEWLFVRLVRRWEHAQYEPEPDVANLVWATAEQHGLKRIVFELDGNAPLTSFVIGQLILLHKRASLSDGVLRLSGLTAEHYHVLELMLLNDRFPNYASREDAVMGRTPQPPEH